jgi:Ca2+-binding EF-hand superfamily protein
MPAMPSDVMTKKCDRSFDMFDADGNGVLEEKDFVSLAASIAQAAGLPAGSPKEVTLMREWRGSWAILLEHADDNRDGQTSREEFHRAMSGAFGDPALLEQNLRGGFEAEFAAIDADADDDGVASVEQMEAFLGAWGLGQDEARVAAGILDHDGDGRITLEEYLAGWSDFLLGKDAESPANGLLGPLN